MSENIGWLIYFDRARGLVDMAPDDGRGAIGSNWQMASSREEAERFVQECLKEGYLRGHENAPRF